MRCGRFRGESPCPPTASLRTRPIRIRPMIGRLRGLDRPLVAVTLAMSAYGLATLYSAGQTDVPTVAATIWHKQVIWLVLGLAAATFSFRLSPRMLEWATPYVYGGLPFILLLTLVIAKGAGTRASEKSWIAIGGLRLGQPAELAKLAVILMLARCLADRKEPAA